MSADGPTVPAIPASPTACGPATPPEIAALHEIFRDARFALLFGSAAAGRLTPTSDLDVAVLYAEPLPVSELARLSGEVERHTGRSSDVVDLLRAGPILKMQVVRHGRDLVVNDRTALARFRAEVPSEYYDFRIERRAAEEALMARMRSTAGAAAKPPNFEEV